MFSFWCHTVGRQKENLKKKNPLTDLFFKTTTTTCLFLFDYFKIIYLVDHFCK